MRGYRSKILNETGKRSIVFKPAEGFRDLEVELPCGKCIGCRATQANEWALRIQHEARYHEKSCFITLTYSPEGLPDDESICKDELTRFIKRLRNQVCYINYRCNCKSKKGRSMHLKIDEIRYYAVGEYGKDKGRPHYHIAVFGWSPPDLELLPIGDQGVFRAKNPLFRSRQLEKLWRQTDRSMPNYGKPLGFVSVGKLTPESAGYVARYVTKKVGDPKDTYRMEKYGEDIEKVKEFALMSRNPGIGSKWFEEFHEDCGKDYLVYDGRKRPVPRYYREKMDDFNRKIAERTKRERKRIIDRLKEKGEMDVRRLDQKRDVMEYNQKENLPRGYEEKK